MRTMRSLSVNRLSMRLVQRLMDRAEQLGVRVTTLSGGATWLDAGIEAPGGFEAGRLIAEIAMGGLGSVALTSSPLFPLYVPGVEVLTDSPLTSCILSQLAGWSIRVGKFKAMGSGPARALARKEAIFGEYGYADDHPEAVIVLETSSRPDGKVSSFLSENCGVSSKNLYMVTTPTASASGAVQISARVVEAGLHKMHTLGIDVSQVSSAQGSCPVPPISRKNDIMMGRTNDALLYGGSASYTFGDAGSALTLLPSIPSSSSPEYGRPFRDLFREAGFDFYKLDPALFSPAIVTIADISTGAFASAGKVNVEVLGRSFGIAP